MSEIHGARIHINGIVQGVGFRPFVYGLAIDLGLKGWVRNTSAGVDIEVDGTPEILEKFLVALQEDAPPLSRITSIDSETIPLMGFETFEILHSSAREGDYIPISPDVSICEDCLRELNDPSDRRYRYPFINCTNCGPRFTIIQDVPYDRPKTTMAPFEMCDACAAEYSDPLDRRFHAQPVACPDCGPHIWLETSNSNGESPEILAQKDDAIDLARRMLRDGKILAIKGLGGFHLACDAENLGAVRELRKRKLRVDKPFALMMKDTDAIRLHCEVDQQEQALLESRQRPVVLLNRDEGSRIAVEVAPGQNTLGVMLPYTPLHSLLFDGDEDAFDVLVMTSANLSEEPIATGNQEARERLSRLADGFLMNDRDIHLRCDDSVVRAAPAGSGNPANYHIRRSRGYAPDPVMLPFGGESILAAGAELKNTFCLTRDQFAFISHHIGDMENYETLQSFEEGITHFENLFRIKPVAIAYDLHPDYLATRYARDRAEREGIPVVGVQHHHAHIAACMGDHGLGVDHKVIGISFDGTGYGEDGAIWGGEVMVADYASYERISHLRYVPLPGGDKAVKEPWRMALSWLKTLDIPWESDLLPVHYASRLPENPLGNPLDLLERQIEGGINAPMTSSMGRLFDAFAALVGVRQTVNYEAQAALELESQVHPIESGIYGFGIENSIMDPGLMFIETIQDVRGGVSIPVISARFHNTIAQMVLETCLKTRHSHGMNEVALSGGVWQNMTLLSRTIPLLENAGFKVYIHQQVPANDGGLALGQALIGLSRLK